MFGRIESTVCVCWVGSDASSGSVCVFVLRVMDESAADRCAAQFCRETHRVTTSTDHTHTHTLHDVTSVQSSRADEDTRGWGLLRPVRPDQSEQAGLFWREP